jgi:hypothetical protein
MSEFYPTTEDHSPISSPVVSRSSQQFVYVVRDNSGEIYGIYTSSESAVSACAENMYVSRIRLNETYSTIEKKKQTLLVDVLFQNGSIGD